MITSIRICIFKSGVYGNSLFKMYTVGNYRRAILTFEDKNITDFLGKYQSAKKYPNFYQARKI